jgi:hypothetical protein
MLMRKQTYRLKEIVYTIAYMVLASGQRVDDEGEDLVHGLPIRPRLHPLEPEVHDLALPSAVGRGRASVAVSATWNGRRRASVSAAVTTQESIHQKYQLPKIFLKNPIR